MTAFLWTVVILMAGALLAEILAFIGMALVAMRAARRSAEAAKELKEKLEPTVQMAKELQQSLLSRMETVQREGQEIAALVATRSQAIQAAFEDTSRRAERIRLRLTEGVETVDGQPARRGIYRQIAEPVHTASQVMRGIKIALWILRKVA
jgi:BMFP domain-containing protein YqiC